MPDQDNVSMEKISLNSGDFADDLGNDFGIQDTQVIANKDLNSFLLSDPDEIVENKKEEQVKEDVKKQQEQQSQQKKQENNNPDKDKKVETSKKEEEKPDGKKALEDLLYGEEQDDENPDEDDQNQGKKTTQKGQPNDQPLDSADDEVYTTLSRDLLRLGVFTKNSEDETEETMNVKTPEQFLERFSLEKKKGAIDILENFLSQFGDDRREMFDAIFVKGVKPQDYLQAFTKIEAMGALDLASEENQERVVRTYYKGLKWDDTRIENKIQKLKDYGDLEDESKAYHEVLLNKEKEATAEMERKRTEELQKTKEKEITQKKSYHRILTEKLKAQEIDGIPLTDKEAAATLEYLTDKKYKLQSGELLSEFDKDLLELNRPENHELKVKLGLLLRKKLDLTTIKKTAISKKSDALFTLSTKNAKQQQNSKEKEMKSFF